MDIRHNLDQLREGMHPFKPGEQVASCTMVNKDPPRYIGVIYTATKAAGSEDLVWVMSDFFNTAWTGSWVPDQYFEQLRRDAEKRGLKWLDGVTNQTLCRDTYYKKEFHRRKR